MGSPAKKNDALTDQPVLPTLLRLSWPIVVGHGMHLTYNLVDTFWVGRLGPIYLAAITVSFPVIFLAFSLGLGFSVSGVALVSQYTGAKKYEKANTAAGQVMLFGFAIAVLFAVLSVLFGRQALSLLGAGEDILPIAWEYFRVIVAGVPLIFVFFMFSSVCEGAGDTLTPMKLKVGSVAFNILLDPLLIFGVWFFPELGIAGAAYATVISRMGAGVLGLYLLFSGRKSIHLRLEHFKPDWEMLKLIVRIGFPAAVGYSALALAIAVLTSIVASVAAVKEFTLAAWGIGNRVTALIRMPAMGFSKATGVLVGQHLGADQPEEASHTANIALIAILVVMLAIAVIFLVVAPYVVTLFTDQSEVIDMASTYLRIAAFAFAFLAVQEVIGGALQGAGKTMQKTFFHMFTLWALQLPFTWLLGHTLGWGENGIWWGIFLAKLTGAAMVLIWFRKGTWKSKVI